MIEYLEIIFGVKDEELKKLTNEELILLMLARDWEIKYESNSISEEAYRRISILKSLIENKQKDY